MARAVRASEPATSEEGVDGRILRSQRSRERILEALVALVREGELQPTGEQVAERAGVGLRTVFRHFEDMESLYREIQARLTRLIRPLLEEPVRGDRLEERIDALVRRRAAAYERMAPFKRSENIRRWTSDFLRESHLQMVRGLREDLHRTLPELRSLPAPLQQASELVTSFEAWDRLRSEQGLGRDRAEEAIVAAVRALLAGAGPEERRR